MQTIFDSLCGSGKLQTAYANWKTNYNWETQISGKLQLMLLVQGHVKVIVDQETWHPGALI